MCCQIYQTLSTGKIYSRGGCRHFNTFAAKQNWLT